MEKKPEIEVALECIYLTVESDARGYYNIRFIDRWGKTVDPVPLSHDELDRFSYYLAELTDRIGEEDRENSGKD